MNCDDIAACLARVGWSAPTAPDLATLASLHEAHLLAVPFENLDVGLGREIVLDLARLHEKLVRRRRGGFCYELNGLFASLLAGLGFDLDMLSACVANDEGVPGPEFDHMALLVRAGGKRWLADVGFGDSFRRPLDLDDPSPQPGGDPLGRAWSVRDDGAALALVQHEADNSTRVAYTFTLTPALRRRLRADVRLAAELARLRVHAPQNLQPRDSRRACESRERPPDRDDAGRLYGTAGRRGRTSGSAAAGVRGRAVSEPMKRRTRPLSP